MSRNMGRVAEEKFCAIFCPLFQRVLWHFICTNSMLAHFFIIFFKVSCFIPLVRQQGVSMPDCHLTAIQAPKKAKYIFGLWNKSDVPAGFCIPHATSLRSLSPHSCQFGSWGIYPFSSLRLMPFIHPLAPAVPALTLSAFPKVFGRTLRFHSHFWFCMIPQSFVPLPDGIKNFEVPFHHFHVSNERQRSWSRSEPLIWGACRSSGLHGRSQLDLISGNPIDYRRRVLPGTYLK